MRWHRLHYAELDRAPVNDDIRLRATQTNYRVAALLARDCCVAIAVASGQVMQAGLDDLCRGSPSTLDSFTPNRKLHTAAFGAILSSSFPVYRCDISQGDSLPLTIIKAFIRGLAGPGTSAGRFWTCHKISINTWARVSIRLTPVNLLGCFYAECVKILVELLP